MLLLAIVVVGLQAAAGQVPTAENPAESLLQETSWTGCLVAGSTPGAFRLNLDEGTAVAGPGDPASLGDPFVQLVPGKIDLSRHVGRHVVVRGKPLSQAEAERLAATRPDQQEANATAAGTGGRPERHFRYVRVTSVKRAAGTCK